MQNQHPRFIAVLALFCLALFKLSHAAIPASLNYQGHLTDASGVPIDGPVTIVFAIYDVASGGTALWSDIVPISVDQGVFSVELGGGGNPFPPGLFESPLWLGLTVGTDSEMSPRRSLSSTAFSFKAGDADTLGGLSPATLDQSTHVSDTGNPHAVTPAQIGAVTQTDADTAHASLQGQISSLDSRVSTLESLTGTVNCNAGDIIDCYEGPVNTLFVGVCTTGYKLCNGSTFGACTAQVLPAAEVCDEQDNNCDGFVDETFDLNSDLANCGACGNDCTTLNWANVVSYLCQSGSCAIETCAPNTQDVNGIPSDGCEAVCVPSGPDTPDAAFFDANCDGIDGDIAASFFVSPTGNDAGSGGINDPFRTIQRGIDAAAADATRKHVLIAMGTYAETPVLADGVSLFGLYESTNWMRSASHTTTVASQGSIGLQVPVYTATGYVEGLSIQSSTATTPGESSRALVMQNISGSLYVRYNTLIPGNGATGTAGGNGSVGSGGGDGNTGQDGCDGCSGNGLGGAGGTSVCTPPGGAGGGGGYDGNGFQGISVPPASGGIGGAASNACFSVAGVGGDGQSSFATGNNGGGGNRPLNQSRGVLTGIDWQALPGNNGSTGGIGGSGAGGGGGGGGLEVFLLCNGDRGGGGGGGGAGGCGGSGGSGGSGGGGSIAILAISANGAIVTDNTLNPAAGGNGGRGGDGGPGGSGGNGGAGGIGRDDSGNGGNGGNGAAGGNGGGGAGGGGGLSVGILRSGSSGLTSSNNQYNAGLAGAGGAGGSPGGVSGAAGISSLDYSY